MNKFLLNSFLWLHMFSHIKLALFLLMHLVICPFIVHCDRITRSRIWLTKCYQKQSGWPSSEARPGHIPSYSADPFKCPMTSHYSNVRKRNT